MKDMKARLTLFCMSFIVVSLLLTHFADAEIDPKTVVGIWLLDSDKGGKINDSGSNNLDGRIIGKPKLIDGKFGSALEFQAGDYTDIQSNPVLDMNDELTLVLWAKGEPQAAWYRLVDKRIGSVVGWEIQSWQDQAGFGIRIDTTDKDNQCTKVDNVYDGTWHHVAFVLNNGSVKLYRDGVKAVDSTYQVGKGFGNQDNLQIGTTNFVGALDEVAIFNVALDDSDIEEIMKDGLEKATGIIELAVSTADRIATTWANIKAQF